MTQTVDVYSKNLGRDWAETEIDAPFLFVPSALALNAAMNGVALEVVSNISGAALKVVAPNNSVSTKEGFYTGDGEAGTNPDTSYAHPGTAALDAPTHALYQLFNILDGAADGLDGKVTLIRWRGAPISALAAVSRVVAFGTPQVGLQHGWGIAYTDSTDRRLVLAAFNSAGSVIMAGLGLMPAVTYDGVEREYAVLLNFKDGSVRTWLNNAEQTPPDEASILAAADTQATLPTCGATFAAANTGSTAGARTPSSALAGFQRDFLIMDLTAYTGDIEAEAPALVEALYRAPHYCLPRYLENF